MAAALLLHLEVARKCLTKVQGQRSFPELLAKQKAHVEQMLATSELNVLDAERVVCALKEIPWPVEVCEGLVEKVTAQLAKNKNLPMVGPSCRISLA